MNCGVCCHCIASVSTDTAVAVPRDWFVGVANRCVALGPSPSSWRLKKASRYFSGFLPLSFFCLGIRSFLPLLPVFLLCICAVLRSLSPQALWFKLLEAVRRHDFGKLSLKYCLLMLKVGKIREDSDKEVQIPYRSQRSPVTPSSPTAFSQAFLFPPCDIPTQIWSLCPIRQFLICEPNSHSRGEDFCCSYFLSFPMITVSLCSGVIFRLRLHFLVGSFV